jgi:hypothetical protein
MVVKRRFLQDPHDVTSQKAAFFKSIHYYMKTLGSLNTAPRNRYKSKILVKAKERIPPQRLSCPRNDLKTVKGDNSLCPRL